MSTSTLETAPFEEKEDYRAEHLEYSDEEIAYRGFLIKRMVGAKNARGQEHTEFDDMDYETHYETNAKAANSYIPPKKNKEDTRVVTGTTREKEHTMISMLLNFNFQPNIVAFDEDDQPVFELGEIMQDMVKKSREIEEYEQQRVLVYKELLDQGSCFVEEQWMEPTTIQKTLKSQDWADGLKVNKITWEKKIVKEPGIAQVNLIAGTRVFLGNIKEFFIEKQPFVFTAERITWEQAKMLYGDWDRFQYVPKTTQYFGEVPVDTGDSTYRHWSLYETEEGQVEVLKYQDKWANEYMVILNGVMMLPIEFPLTAVSPSGEYTIAKGDSEPISRFFAYSKSAPAKTKVDQSIVDEMTKVFIGKVQKSLKWPLANNTGRVLSRDVFLPGKIVSGVDPEKLKPIGQVEGITQSEFAMYELMRKLIDEKTVSASISGDITKATLGEVLEAKRASMQKIGYALVGVTAMEMRLAWLRIHNIIRHWTEPVDRRVSDVRGKLQGVHRTISVSTHMEDGADGVRSIEFSDQLAGRIPSEQMLTIDQYLSQREGRPIRKTYLSPSLLKKLKFKWYITINPTEKDASEIKRATFMKNVSDAKTIFGPMSTNDEFLKGRFAGLIGEDPEQYWSKGAPTMPMMGGEVQPDQMQRQVAQGIMGPTKQPTVNTLARA